MHTVSVIIPCFNAEQYVQQALESALVQTKSVLEVICVDDGSFDGTPELLESLAAEYSIVTVIHQENKGATAARNKGLSLATGDYIQFLDADDVLKPTKLENQLLIAETEGFPALVIGGYTKYDSFGTSVYSQCQSNERGSLWLKLMRTRLGITSANLFARQAVIDAGAWDESLKSSQEYELMFRMMQRGAAVALSAEIDTEVHQRNPHSITATDQGTNWKRYLDLRLSMREHITRHVLDEDMRAMDQVIFDTIRMIYTYDSEEAFRLMKKLLPKGYRPSASEFTSQGYIAMFNILGFRNTERLRGLIRRS